MPAPNSILKPTKNPFAPVDKMYKIYRKCLEICLKLPKRYTFLVSQNFMDSAHNLRKFAKGANSIMPTNKHEVQARRDCWLKARIYRQFAWGTICRNITFYQPNKRFSELLLNL